MDICFSDLFVRDRRGRLWRDWLGAGVGQSIGAGQALSAGHLPTGSIGIRLAEVDAASAADPRARLYVIDRVAPGTTIRRTVAISNDTGAARDVATYVSGATIAAGAFVGADGASANELSSWITLSRSTLHLASAGKAKVVATIVVPALASAGERYGVIWAEVRSGNASTGIVTVNRVGIRVYLSVGEGGAPPSSFVIRTLAGARGGDGAPVVEALVANTGGRALDLSGELNLTQGPGGSSAEPFAAALGTTLAIGASSVVLIRLPKALPDGPWLATLDLRSGLITGSGQATISFVNGSKPVDAQSNVMLQVLLGLTIVAVVVLSGALFRSLRARRRRRSL